MNSKSIDITAEKLTQLRALFPRVPSEVFSEDKVDFARLGYERKRGFLFVATILGALLVFEVFNYSSTLFALRDILGNLSIGPFRWANLLAFAFCGIDFAIIVRIFTPEKGHDEAAEYSYLFASWFLAAAFNAMLTWWALHVAMLQYNSAGGSPPWQPILMNVVPIFIAIMALLIRVLLVNTFSTAGERLLNIREFGTALKVLSHVSLESKTPRVSESSATNSSDSPKVDSEAEVLFTAYHPKEAKVDTWYSLFVYAHLLSATDDIHRDAKRHGGSLAALREITSSSTPIARGTEITVVPTCQGITFNPKKLTFEWIEDYHRTDFRFRADKSLQDDAAKGYIDFYVGPVIVGSLKFAMLFNNNFDRSLVYQEEKAAMYHQDKIFISYSHKDTDIVLAFKRVHEATGYDVLIDIENLRSGQEWNPELMRMIDSADIFQLFWSENSKNSKYCQQEWKHALKRDIAGFIRPIYWQKPIPNPPRQLRKYHFEYVEL